MQKESPSADAQIAAKLSYSFFIYVLVVHFFHPYIKLTLFREEVVNNVSSLFHLDLSRSIQIVKILVYFIGRPTSANTMVRSNLYIGIFSLRLESRPITRTLFGRMTLLRVLQWDYTFSGISTVPSGMTAVPFLSIRSYQLIYSSV